MVEQYKIAYNESRRVRIAVSLGLCGWGVLLYSLAGGFPPWAWRFLLHVVLQLPQLWVSHGSTIIVPLLGLVLLSFSLFIFWSLLGLAIYRVVLYWWHHLHEHEHFVMDLREAESIAEEAVTGEGSVRKRDDHVRWQEAAAPTLPVQAVQPQPIQARQQVYARASRVVGASGLIRVPSAVFSNDTPFPDEDLRSQPSRSHPGTAPTLPNPRVAMEPRTQFTQSMQVAQQTSRKVAGSTHTTPFTGTPAAPRVPLTMREQLRIVPRPEETSEHDEGYDTIPLPGDKQDITVHDTLVDNGPITTNPAKEDAEENDDEENGYENTSVIQIVDTEDMRTEDADTLHELPLQDVATRPDRESFPSSEPLRLLVGIGLDAGIERKDAPNEDNLFAIQGMRPSDAGPEPVGLFVVADGMGGHAHGQEASKLAVHAISDAIVPVLMRQVSNEQDEIFPDLLKDGVHRANLAIYRRNREEQDMMGTTLTAVLVVANMAYVVNVGDSRTYLYRPQEGMRQITRDHSVVARLVEKGDITHEEVYTHPRRNQIYRCLGERASIEVDTFTEELQANDVLILCSDGLWEMVHDDEMEDIIASSAAYPAQLSKILIQSALMRGGADNISVIVACIAPTEGAP